MESFYKRDVAEKCYRALYMTMLNIQIVGEEQVPISLYIPTWYIIIEKNHFCIFNTIIFNKLINPLLTIAP